MHALCCSFIRLGDETWHNIASAWQVGLLHSEETITETNLFYLQRRHPWNIRIRAFHRRREARTGADWEWWIGGRGSWFGMRVQAKKMSYPRPEFRSLQTYGPRRSSNRQIDILIREAHRDRLNAAYVFYVSSPLGRSQWLQTLRRPCPFAPFPGCLIADACAVKATNSCRLKELARISLPWNCLVCPCPQHPAPPGGLARQAFQTLDHSRYGLRDLDQPVIDHPWHEPRETLPDYLLALERAELDAEGDEALRRRASERGLAGFIILRED